MVAPCQAGQDCQDLGFKAEIRIKEVKISSVKPTVIE